jgi:hypothetical protein
VSAATPLDYAARCERYARQRGWAYAVNRPSIGHLTPRQRRRAMHKENRANRDWQPSRDWGTERDDEAAGFGEEIIADLQGQHDALVTGLEQRFLGDLDGWTVASVMWLANFVSLGALRA